MTVVVADINVVELLNEQQYEKNYYFSCILEDLAHYLTQTTFCQWSYLILGVIVMLFGTHEMSMMSILSLGILMSTRMSSDPLMSNLPSTTVDE